MPYYSKKKCFSGRKRLSQQSITLSWNSYWNGITGNTLRNIAHLHLYSKYTAVSYYYNILSSVHLNSLTLIKKSIFVHISSITENIFIHNIKLKIICVGTLLGCYFYVRYPSHNLNLNIFLTNNWENTYSIC